MLFPSQYNHLVELKPRSNQKTWVLSNLFFGASSIITESLYQAFAMGEKEGVMPEDLLPEKTWEYFIQKGFAWKQPDAEEKFIRSAAYSQGSREQIASGLNGGHYGFITSLYCNLACPYCFQKQKADSCGFLTKKQVDLGIEAIQNCEKQVASQSGGKPGLPKISITGGEPLLTNQPNLEVLNYLIDRLSELHWPFSITTNGTELAEFVSSHELVPGCRNIQVTLDGPKWVHDQRRCYRNGAPSFDRICESVDAALADQWIVNLRVNLDIDNVQYLPTLAEFVQSRGWKDHQNFYAYVSPVTDHGSLGGYDVPVDEADLLEALLNVVDDAPLVREVFDIRHFRGFNYVECMLLQKAPRYPVMYRCEAVMGMYIFDPRGDIHVCLEAVGNPALRVGVYDPQFSLDESVLSRWVQRNVMSIPGCDNCKIRFLCAGGCTYECFQKSSEKSCMPFLREMEIAWGYYAKTKAELFEVEA